MLKLPALCRLVAGLAMPAAAAALLVLSACDLQQQGPPPSYQDSKLDVTNAINGPAAAEAPTATAASASAPSARP
jgi:hypothetical protein